MDEHIWWQHLAEPARAGLRQIWIPVGVPGHTGERKVDWETWLNRRFGAGGWRISYYVRGRIVSKAEAIIEYEQSYRVHLHTHPDLVRFLVTTCGNVYDDNPTNVFDHSYEQPHTRLNHYQDIAVRRVIAELVDDPTWPDVTDTPAAEADLIDLNNGQLHRAPRARGFRGDYLMQIRGPESPGFFLNPAVVPVHDPTLLTALPGMRDWYLHEGCAHLSVEAFWQMSKVIEVRYDAFLQLKEQRLQPLAGLGQ
ncbi:MAG: hypothetical protein FOGNACKC_02687 [Anaerolineae bacterium]|nr:hypothetical protein [Anaerolineae bacterium]